MRAQNIACRQSSLVLMVQFFDRTVAYCDGLLKLPPSSFPETDLDMTESPKTGSELSQMYVLEGLIYYRPKIDYLERV
ncbi:hypothetical protein L596_000523 [Steinernema carpocapsae]|uniref:Uncharacterized protein n=1 Tax=Steinernema carpocapsae TaxID=34508 RepID=A0A4U8UJ25_STECR|nr:hypothetical protein L596_000523 [Steinernema carpocapsae]